jgi:hypothetical protein
VNPKVRALNIRTKYRSVTLGGRAKWTQSQSPTYTYYIKERRALNKRTVYRSATVGGRAKWTLTLSFLTISFMSQRTARQPVLKSTPPRINVSSFSIARTGSHFSNVLCTVTLCNKYNRALNFENLRQVIKYIYIYIYIYYNFSCALGCVYIFIFIDFF